MTSAGTVEGMWRNEGRQTDYVPPHSAILWQFFIASRSPFQDHQMLDIPVPMVASNSVLASMTHNYYFYLLFASLLRRNWR